MAHFYVGNVNFESTANNQLVYSANVITVRIAGANVMTINSTGVSSSGLAVPDQLFATITSNLAIRANNSFIVTGAVAYRGNVTPTAIAANTADWAPGVGNVYNIRVSANNNTATSEYMITGMTAGTNGQLVAIHNIGDMGIWIRNEEAGSNGAILPANNTPSSTAANRFSLPNHFKLNGSQSATFYYDGVSSRWRMVDSAALPFDHKKALTKSFFLGGYASTPGAYVATGDRTTHSSETTAAVVGSNLSQARGYLSSVGNACKGYSGGGFGNAPTPTVATSDRTTYATEVTAAVPTANFTISKGNVAGVGNADKGFLVAGFTPTPANRNLTEVERVFYNTEVSTVVPGAAVSQARESGRAFGNDNKGFFAGGRTSSSPVNVWSAVADKITYFSETSAAVPGANMTLARGYLASAGNVDKGFYFGGGGSGTPGFFATVDRTTYSTEVTAAVPGANLSQARADETGAGNACKSFVLGGTTPLSVATADRTTYSTEVTAAVPGANLSQARHTMSGI